MRQPNAREKIADPEHWTQHRYAATADGSTCYPTSRLAVRWCAIGSLNAVAGTGNIMDKVHIAHIALQAALGGNSVVEWQDEHNHADVLDLFDRTIARMIMSGNPSV